MDLEILKNEKMAQTGETLQSLMGDVLPPLDLLVRESIQNSLDAAKKKEKNERVTVEYTFGEFDSKNFCSFLDCEISDTILQMLGDGRKKFLSIHDSGTVGLTGTIKDSTSNLSKLVYQVFQKQQDRGAGGSCGVGKTTYLKLGKGLVFYYSAIQTRSGQETRLAGILAEDPKTKRIIRAENSRGIAFFGEYEKKSNLRGLSKSTGPITDKNQARGFLDLFGLKPYAEGESGTTIIIPYIDDADLLRKSSPDAKEGTVPPSWCASIEAYIETAVQRWYFARLNNHDYNGAWLEVIINGNRVVTMHPFFMLLQKMYNIASDSVSLNESTLHLDKIRKNVVKGSDVGNLVWTIISPKNYNLRTNRYKDIHSLVRNFLSQDNDSILTFTRQPGMAITYKCGANSWMPSNAVAPDGEILIALFRLNSESGINQDTVEKMRRKDRTDVSTLEDYVRSCEREDHYDWVDLSGIEIISKIKEGVRTDISRSFMDMEEQRKNGTQHTISAKLTKALMPIPAVYEKTSETNERRMSGSGRSTAASIKISDISFERGSITVNYDLQTYTEGDTSILILIRGETGSYDSETWTKEIGTCYPYRIQSASVYRISWKKKTLIENTIALQRRPTQLINRIDASYADDHLIIHNGKGARIEGTLTLACESIGIPFDLKMENLQ